MLEVMRGVDIQDLDHHSILKIKGQGLLINITREKGHGQERGADGRGLETIIRKDTQNQDLHLETEKKDLVQETDIEKGQDQILESAIEGEGRGQGQKIEITIVPLLS